VTTLPPDILAQLEGQGIELPSWAFGNSGTRFRVFTTPGTPRDPFEKIADAATVNRFTALAPSVALHIPWDKVDSYDELRRHAEDLGVSLGTINSNTSRTRTTSSAPSPTPTTRSAARPSTTTSSASTSCTRPAPAT
jgi:L-rhamnose isomerase/sugar isomerase